MKRILTSTVTILLLLGIFSSAAIAANIGIQYDNSMSFSFALSVNGSSNAAAVAPGDTITLEVKTSRADLNAGFNIYSLLTEMVYDSAYFELVYNSVQTPGNAALRGEHALWDLSGTEKRVDMGYYAPDLSGAQITASSFTVGSFQLKVRELPAGVNSATTTLKLQNCYLGTYDGMGRYLTGSQGSVSVTITRPTGNNDNSSGGGVIDTRPSGSGDQRPSETNILDNETPLTGIHFIDVLEDHWAYEYIEYLSGLGFVVGYPDGTFAPSGRITRAEFVTILARMSGEDLPEGYSGPFTDVATGSYYGNAVQWAVGSGVTKGTSETTFSPNALITREQMAVMLVRYAVGRNYVFVLFNDPVDFSDGANISSYAKDSVKVMQQADIINGYNDGSFRPQGSATRAESAKLMAMLHYLMNN